MSRKRKNECCTRKNATANVDVLMIVVSGLKVRDWSAIVSIVCQGMITLTDISSESIVVLLPSGYYVTGVGNIRSEALWTIYT